MSPFFFFDPQSVLIKQRKLPLRLALAFFVTRLNRNGRYWTAGQSSITS